MTDGQGIEGDKRMFERQLTRIDTVRQYVDDMLKACEDKETARCGFVHLYGVGQACALIALRRGHDRACLLYTSDAADER